MKTPIKIVLLVVFALIAVGGVLMFLKTRVAPPVASEDTDQFVSDLKVKVDSFSSIKDFEASKHPYAALSDRMRRFNTENYLNDKDYDKYAQKVDTLYGRRLSSYSFAILRQAQWPEDKLNASLANMNTLNNKKLLSGEPSLNSSLQGEFNSFKNIVAKYHQALAFSKSTGFTGVSSAAAKIKQAEAYKSDPYLCNNSSLVAALNDMPRRLADAHYSYVSGKVNSLRNYSSYSEDYYFNTLLSTVQSAINEYKNTNIYGSNKKSVSSLESTANNYAEQAANYYIY